MAVCEACGTKNRDKARFCLGCAQALAPLTDAGPAVSTAAAVAPAGGPVQTCPVCQIANPLAATVCKSCRGSLVPDVVKVAPAVSRPASQGLAFKALGMIGLGLLAVAVWWWGAQGITGHALALSSSPPLSPAAAPTLSAVPASTAVALGAAPAPPPVASVAADQAIPSAEEKAASEKASAKRLAAAQARRDQAARERAATEERARAAIVLEQQRADEAAREKAAAEAAQRAVVVKAAQPAPAPVLKTVEQTCASSGNFFSRGACRLRTCGEASFAIDPVCVRFREMEAANRRAVMN